MTGPADNRPEPIASPATRAHAARKGVDLAALAQATGRETLAREDVDRAAAGREDVDRALGQPGPGQGAPAASPAGAPAGDARYWQVDHAQYGPVREEALPRRARVAADNLAAAGRMIPAVTHHDRADIRALEALRKALAPEAAAAGVKLTALAFQVRALAQSLRAHPRANASLSADGATLILKDYVHVGIAVDSPHGLMVPVIRDADRKGLLAIAAAIADLAARAQDRALRPDEMGGASISISNLGGIGGTAFTPIVNPPEAAILGLTRAETVPVWDGTAWNPVPMAPLHLSYDHRILNGADAARLLNSHKALLENPRRLLL